MHDLPDFARGRESVPKGASLHGSLLWTATNLKLTVLFVSHVEIRIEVTAISEEEKCQRMFFESPKLVQSPTVYFLL